MGIEHDNTGKYDKLTYDGIAGWNPPPKYDPPKAPLFPSYRLLVAVTCMACTLSNFASQDSMSSAMVCMIRRENTSTTHGLGLQHTRHNDTLPNPDVEKAEDTFTTHQNIQAWRFDWSPETQGWILFSFFVCYFTTQLPAGLLIARFGAKNMLVGGLVCASLGHLLTVPATQMGLIWVYLARCVAGLSTGCLYPATLGLIAKWAPRHETGFLIGITGVGIEIGNTFSFGVSMFACEASYQGGWPFVFYCIGGSMILLALFIAWRVSDCPSDNKYVSQSEALYIERGVAGSDVQHNKRKTPTPIKRIARSMPVYASAVSQAGTLLMYYTVITEGPVYLRDVIQLSSFQINLLLAVPFIAVIPLVYCLGTLSDWLVARGSLTMTSLRKLMDTFCKVFGVLAVIGLGLVPTHDVVTSFACFFLVALTISVSYVSYVPNGADLSPAHSGIIAAIQQAGSLWVSFVIPPAVGVVVEEKTRDSWQTVFLAEAFLQVAALVFFLKFGSGGLQPWALGECGPCEVVVSTGRLEKAKLVASKDHETKNKTTLGYGTVPLGK